MLYVARGYPSRPLTPVGYTASVARGCAWLPTSITAHQAVMPMNVQRADRKFWLHSPRYEGVQTDQGRILCLTPTDNTNAVSNY